MASLKCHVCIEKVNHVGDPIGISQDTGCLLGENLEQYEKECEVGEVCMVDILTDWLAEGTGLHKQGTIPEFERFSIEMIRVSLIKAFKLPKLSADVPKQFKKKLAASRTSQRVKAIAIAKRLATLIITTIMI